MAGETQRGRFVGGDHFYTIWEWERQNAKDNLGYREEGIACWVYPASPKPAGTTALYRWMGPDTPCGDHFYGYQQRAKDFAQQHNYTYEGVACSVLLTTGGGPGRPLMYQMFSPTTSDHFYTVSQEEITTAHNLHGLEPVPPPGVFVVWDSPGSEAGIDRVPLYRLVST